MAVKSRSLVSGRVIGPAIKPLAAMLAGAPAGRDGYRFFAVRRPARNRHRMRLRASVEASANIFVPAGVLNLSGQFGSVRHRRLTLMRGTLRGLEAADSLIRFVWPIVL
jgi:hypothetical protein